LSHAKERQEKVCLNCNIPIHGRYCHQCGQQNTEPKESAWGLVTHFFYDITHFDGSFFSTVKYLVTRPGFLSAEYIKGRRASYLNPIRMYVFTSAFFFIIFFSLIDFDDAPVFKPDQRSDTTSSGVLTNAKDTITSDSAVREKIRRRALSLAKTKQDSAEILMGLNMVGDSLDLDDNKSRKKKKGVQFSFKKNEFRTVAAYDSAQKALPASEKDNWLQRTLRRKQISLYQKYGKDDTTIGKLWLSAFVHQFPKLLFVSLPLFALILRLLYIRRKQFYYVDHGIFSIHLYIFMFVLMLVSIGINRLDNWLDWGIFAWLQAALWIYALYYTYKAMRNFYKQGRGKTILKFILLNILATICIIFLFAVFFVFAAYQL
jgi:hypothetical protein